MDARGPCPDAEALAAWLDQGVGSGERAQIEAHLAGCDDCRVIVAHVLETRTAVLGAPTPLTGLAPRVATASRFPRRRVVWVTASVLATAAMLSLLLVAPSWWPWGSGGIDSKLADLAAAVGSERIVEARLTGGFVYGPLRAAVRSGGSSVAPDNWSLYAAAGKIREDADRDPAAAHLHALGLAHLVLGEYDEAVGALQDAVAEDPQRAQYSSDLAAAYLARARQLDRPDDYPRALGAAERAVTADDRLLEARFNRALALEALFLRDEARRAWDDYLTHDGESGWAAEARARLQARQPSDAPGEPGAGDVAPAIGETTVEAALDWLVREGLPAWAAAVLVHDAARAARVRDDLATYASRLHELSGDVLPLALAVLTSVDSIDTAVRLRQLGDALKKLEAEDIAAGEERLRTACEGAMHPLAALCDVELGVIDVLRRQPSVAQDRFESALAAAAGSWTYVTGRAYRGEGDRRLFESDYRGAAESYRAAFDILGEGRYLRQMATLAFQLADLNELSGLPRQAARWRVQGLALMEHSSPTQRFLARFSASAFLNRKQEYEAAALVAPDIDDPAFDAVSPLVVVSALVDNAKSALALGNPRAAREMVDRAQRLLIDSKDARAEARRPTVRAVEAAVLAAEGSYEPALGAIDEAIATMGPERAVFKAEALLERARIRLRGSGRAAGGEADVQAALRLLAARAAPSQPLALDDARAAVRAIAAVVSADPGLRAASGLFLAEQLRELLDGVPEAARLATREAFERTLGAGGDTPAYVFLFTEDSLLTWAVRAGEIRFVDRPIAPRDIERLVARLTVQVARSPLVEDTWRATLSDLHDTILGGLPWTDASSLLFIPEGPLARVPFGALFDAASGQFLFERAHVRVATNLAFALNGSAAASGVPDSVLAIGEPSLDARAANEYPPLPNVRSEAIAIASLYPRGAVLVAAGATKSEVLKYLPTAAVLHFAGHATSSASSGGSRLLLAEDSLDARSALAAEDLRGRVAQARVVLAACETAADAAERAAGVASITGAFLRAGAAAVIGTLWKVDDRASAEFFQLVHRGLRAGHRTSVALAQAQRACQGAHACRTAVATWLGAVAYGAE